MVENVFNKKNHFRRKRMRVKLVIGIVLMGLFSVGDIFSGGSTEDSGGPQNYKLMVAHNMSTQSPYHIGYEKWSKTVTEKTEGVLTLEVYPSEQLGAEADVVEQARNGLNVCHNTDAARIGNYLPELGAFLLPYFLEGQEDVDKALKLDIVQNWFKELADKHGLQIFSYKWALGFKHLCLNKPLDTNTPAAVKGLLLRTPPNKIWQDSVKALGVTTVGMGKGDLYSAIQTGVINGATLCYSELEESSFYEVMPYMYETANIWMMNCTAGSSKWFKTLPKDLQTILVDECDKAAVETTKGILEDTEKSKERLKARGVKIVPTDRMDIEGFKRASAYIYDEYKLTNIREELYKGIGKL
jgi:TRAP-type C4-dicarboxylate transport system substrate-binding protein